MLLVNVSYLCRLAYFYRTAVRLFQSHYQPEKRGLAGSVRTYDTDNSRRWKHKVQMFKKKLVSVGLADIVKFDDLVAEMRSVWNEYFQTGFLFTAVCGGKLLVCAQTSLLLGLPCLWGHTNPLELPFESLAALAFLLFLLCESLALLVKPGRVVTLPRNSLSPVKLKYPSCNVVKEIPVVRNRNDGTLVLLKMSFKPLYALGIKMVGRLVQKQHVRLLQKKPAKGDTASFTS